MSQQERVDKLAKAIDDLLDGREPELEDEDLAQLLQIARIRHEVGQEAASAGAPYQGVVWERLAARIRALMAQRASGPKTLTLIMKLKPRRCMRRPQAQRATQTAPSGERS